MKNQIALSAVILSLSVITSQAANLLANGNLEANTAGLPDGWSYTQGDGPATLQSGAVSPFTNIYPAGTASALFTDGAGEAINPLLSKTFTIQSGGILYVAWDFRLSGLTGSPWVVQIDDSATALMRFDMDRTAGNFFSVETNTPFSGSYSNVLALQSNVWYQVQLTIDITNKTVSGSITSESLVTTPIAPTTWRTTPGGALSLNRILIADDPLSASTGANVVFDNLAVDRTAFAPAPEPSAALLLGASVE